MSSARTTVLHLPLFLRLTALGSLAVVLTGCPGGGTLDEMTGTGGGSGETCNAEPIFVAKCDGVFCHGSDTATPPTGGVELVTPPAGMTLGQSLYDRAATYPTLDPASCPTATPERIIDSVAPATSLLLEKLSGVGLACGAKMPPAPITITAEELDCVTKWVNSVAQTGGI